MRQAIRLTRWLMHEHYEVVREVAGGSSVAPLFDTTDGTDTEGLKEAILQRLRDKGPLFPRDLQRSIHQLPALKRDAVLGALKSAGRLVEMDDGRLMSAA